MKAMVLNRITNLRENDSPLELTDIPKPLPGSKDLLVKVSACGVCHTELDEIEGRILRKFFPIVLVTRWLAT